MEEVSSDERVIGERDRCQRLPPNPYPTPEALPPVLSLSRTAMLSFPARFRWNRLCSLWRFIDELPSAHVDLRFGRHRDYSHLVLRSP
jgi:hypothetical protein